MLKKATLKKVHEYLHQHSLADALSLGENNILSFHWANDELASNYVRGLYRDESERESLRKAELEKELLSLKETPVWLMSRQGQMKSDLYNLYLCYLDPRLRNQWFELDEILVSTNHEAGPFQSLKAMRWLDKEIYARFIYLKMINAWVPQRKFRLSLDIPLEVRPGGSPFQSMKGKIHQISRAGLVLHLSTSGLAREWQDYDEIVFLKKELSLVKEGSEVESCMRTEEWVKSLENFTLTGKDFYQLVSQCAEEQGDREYFLFVPFNQIKMLSIRSQEHCVKNLLSLLDEAKDTIHEYIEAA